MFPNGAVYTPTDTVQGVFNTYDTDGLPITLGGNPVLRLERNRGGTWSEVTTTASAGMTLSVDEDDTGRHEYTVDLDHANVSAAAGDAYRVAINVGTVDGQSIVGAPVGTFYVLADGLTSQQKADVEAESVDALQSLKLDHLVAVADADDVADDSIMAKLAAGDGDWSSFAPSTDALQAILSQLTDHVISDSVNDASATATGFTAATSVGSDVRVGFLRFTSGALEGEGRLVSWTGTTVAVLSDSSMPTALKQYSAAPANSVTFDFTPL